MENFEIVDNFFKENFVIKKNMYSFAAHLLTNVQTSTKRTDKHYKIKN